MPHILLIRASSGVACAVSIHCNLANFKIADQVLSCGPRTTVGLPSKHPIQVALPCQRSHLRATTSLSLFAKLEGAEFTDMAF